MRHIDAYVLYEYGDRYIPELTKSDVSYLLTRIMDFPFSEEKLERYFKNPPKTKYIVHALYEKGFQPKTIAEWLHLNASSVSYHLNNPLQYPYINPQLRSDIQWFDDQVEERMLKNQL